MHAPGYYTHTASFTAAPQRPLWHFAAMGAVIGALLGLGMPPGGGGNYIVVGQFLAVWG